MSNLFYLVKAEHSANKHMNKNSFSQYNKIALIFLHFSYTYEHTKNKGPS